MDWYKTKNILIFVLIILNITLFTLFYNTNAQNKIIKNQTNENIIAILEKNNITLDKKLIPEVPESFDSRYIERAVPENTPFLTKLMGEKFSYDDTSGTYKTDTKTLSVNKDIFDYSNSKPENPPEEKSEKYIKQYCIKKMKALGVDYKLYEFNGFNYTENTVKAIFTPTIEDYKFFDSFISFELCESGISAISGKNLILSKTASGISSKVFDISSVLLDLCSNETINKSQINKIVDISLGYFIGRVEEKYSNVLAISAWQIVFDNGTILYYDARNGKFLQ